VPLPHSKKRRDVKVWLYGFAIGFVLGTAFMASPAIGLLVSFIAACGLIYTQFHTPMG